MGRCHPVEPDRDRRRAGGSRHADRRRRALPRGLFVVPRRPGTPGSDDDHRLDGRPLDPRTPSAHSRPAGRSGRAGRRRGTAADRPGVARHGRAQHRRHRHPGRGGPARHRHATVGGSQRPRRHRGHQPRHLGWSAPDAGRATADGFRGRHTTGTGTGSRRTRRSGGAGPGRGGAGRRRVAPGAAAAAGGDRSVRVPHRPGSDHQCGPPCGCHRLPGDRRPAGGRTVHRNNRRRQGPVRSARRGRLRADGHAGTGGTAARRVHGRTTRRGRLPRRGTAPAAGGRHVIRVLLTDDQPLVRHGLRVLIADRPGLEVVGEAADGEEAVRLADLLGPDVVVMDIRMPRMNGLEATRRIVAGSDTPPKVLILTTFDDDEYVYGALRAGASGFLVKDMDMDQILTAIEVVAAGDALLAPSVTRRLIAEFSARPDATPPSPRPVEGITVREREVLTLVGSGLSNAELATRLHISVATAKAHVGRLLTKLDARDRVQLVILAYELGLVTPTSQG
ncbi:response regulator transcription factor [Streptomyces sp. UH6]|nr:response regulator transcription factor [Streptomyces sp. UH6]